jgi:hypothetical protein
MLAELELAECCCVDIGVYFDLCCGEGLRDNLQDLHSPPFLLWSCGYRPVKVAGGVETERSE